MTMTVPSPMYMCPVYPRSIARNRRCVGRCVGPITPYYPTAPPEGLVAYGRNTTLMAPELRRSMAVSTAAR